MNTNLPTSMPTTNRPRNAGKSMNDDTSRLDAVAKVTGRARFGRDTYPTNGLFAAFVRCPYGAATLASDQRDAALKTAGVVDVVINGDRGQFAGDPVGYVVAESPLALRRGLAALAPTWDRQPVKTTIADGAAPAPELEDDTKKMLDGAAHRLTATYETAVQTHSSFETHGVSIDFDGDRAVVYASTQGTFAVYDGIERALEIEQSKIEVVCEYIGGGFGSKLNGAGREGMTAGRIAKKFGRPVYLFVDRRGEHLDTGNRPSSRTHVDLAVRKDGTIAGGQVHTWGGVGVARGGGGCQVPSGRYDFGEVQRSHENVKFNGGGPRAFRAPGCPQGAFAEELLMDEVAALVGQDPLALRQSLDPSEHRTAMYELGASIIGWSQRGANGSGSGTIRRGFGVGSTSWHRFPARTEAEVVIHRDGSVTARSGTQDIGTGLRTVVGVVASDALGVDLARVNVEVGRSSLPIGPGSGGSVTTHNVSPAVTRAAEDARDQLLDRLAEDLGTTAASLTIVGGQVLRDGASVMSFDDACKRAITNTIAGRGRWGMSDMRSDPTTGHTEGVQFVESEVDIETGVIRVKRIIAVQACGRVVCRKTAESQILGAVIQGLSYALFEEKRLDRRTGAMVNPNLEWYRIAGTNDMPHIEPILFTEDQDGVRGLGEPPTIPTAGAIACSVFNALGSPVRSLPLTPARVLAARDGGAA